MWLVPAAALAAFIGAAAGTAGGFALAMRLYLPRIRAAMVAAPRDPSDPPAWAPEPVEKRYPDAVVVSGAQFSRLRKRQ
jgi:hypothetical protein